MQTHVTTSPNRSIPQHGFTLIELLVTVAVLSILAGIAYPSYTNYVTAARRADGMSATLRLASDLERFRGNCGQYTATIVGGSPNQPACSGLGLPPNSDMSPDRYYRMTIVLIPDPNGSGAATGYTINATPLLVQATRDTGCGTLSLLSRGDKLVSGPKTAKECWKQ